MESDPVVESDQAFPGGLSSARVKFRFLDKCHSFISFFIHPGSLCFCVLDRLPDAGDTGGEKCSLPSKELVASWRRDPRTLFTEQVASDVITFTF